MQSSMLETDTRTPCWLAGWASPGNGPGHMQFAQRDITLGLQQLPKETQCGKLPELAISQC